jgi:hypothetical protein
VPPNTILLINFPNLLKDLENLFLLELIDLEFQDLAKNESEPPSSMLFDDALDIKKEKEKDLQMMKTPMIEEMDLPMMSLMKQISRTMSPSPSMEILKLWDPFCASLMETELRQKPFSLSTLDTSC